MRHLPEKQFMLELVNEARREAGVGQVVLGSNIAAQLHAEAALENCFSGHWGLDGLKPYMRYSLAGGYQANSENVSGLDYCISSRDGYRALYSIEYEIREAMAGLMRSPGHRQNILNPAHKKVNIGLAWDRYNTKMVQHFEGAHVEFAEMPTVRGGVLRFQGSVKNGAQTGSQREFGVQIFYDAPPGNLTLGQLARTYCYDNGLQVASLREPLTGGNYWPTHQFQKSYQPCRDPADLSPSLSTARSYDEAHTLWQAAYQSSLNPGIRSVTVPWVTASQYVVGGSSFTVEADISGVLARHGPGVYSVVVWGLLGGEQAILAEYSVFHEVEPPMTYEI